MKLISKLTVFITMSKLALVLLFVLTLPFLTTRISRSYTDQNLRLQKEKVRNMVQKEGVESYFQGEESYGSYTMLKEEYISLEAIEPGYSIDTIYTDRRIIEQDTLSYRVLIHTFIEGNTSYLLEIGKTTSAIEQYSRPLQRIATVVLLVLILMTMLLDLIYTRYLLHPLGKIIRSRLRHRKFPFNENTRPIKTSTTDFRYLDTSLVLLMEQIHEAFEKEREFTANASHELMTPIGILQNKIENLMDEPELSDLVQDRLLGMQKTLNRLKRIVHSLLLISRIENDQFSKNDKVNVIEIFNDLIEEIGHRLSERGITLEISVSDKIFLQNVNRDLIFQMLYNLINNAIKYNESEGAIFISDHQTLEGNYCISIRDNGIGISDDEVGTIFNRFKKVNKSEESTGYGLGLAIVKSIADYHQIKLEVKSKVTEGTNFILMLPNELLG